MKIYKISQDVNNDYDTFDSAVVFAENEEEAKRINPNNFEKDLHENMESWELRCWANINDIKVEYIGENKDVKEKGLILASFNAG